MITNPLLLIAAATLVGIAAFAGLLHLIPRLGAAGTRISAWLCRAPGLDLIVSLFTWVPPTVLGILYGWRGVAGAILEIGRASCRERGESTVGGGAANKNTQGRAR